MQKETKSILDELSNISFTKDKENVVESRASHILESAIRLIHYIRENFDNLKKLKSFKIQSKYKFLDQVFLKVLERNPKIMPKIFCDMFKVKANTVIKFLSNKSNFIEDISIILKMPKSTFIKALFY